MKKSTPFFFLKDIDPTVKEKVFEQDYETKLSIKGVRVVELNYFVEEDGDFGEILRITNGEVEGFPGFRIAQVNRTRLNSQAIKAWHFHVKQHVLWYISPAFNLFVGLWDIRNNSSTKGNVMRVLLGQGKSTILLIPPGVAHGAANFSENPVNLYYFTNCQFNKRQPDEKRLPWDSLGESFWLPQRDK